MWQYSKNLKCDKTQNTQNGTTKQLKFDKTKKIKICLNLKPQMWQKSINLNVTIQNVTQLIKKNVTTQKLKMWKNSEYDKTEKLKMWQTQKIKT